MEQWVRNLINSVTSGLTSLINATIDRILWVYNVFIALFIKVRAAFDGALNGIRTKLTALLRVAQEIYVTLRWIVLIRIPQVVNSAVSHATNYLLQQVESARLFLRSLMDGLSSWIQQQIRRIDAFIDSVIRWATTTVNTIWSTVTHVRDIVMNLLTDPRRLAAWAIDAITGEFLRWIDRNADRLFQLIRQRSIHYTLQFADRIESMLSRLL